MSTPLKNGFFKIDKWSNCDWKISRGCPLITIFWFKKCPFSDAHFSPCQGPFGQTPPPLESLNFLRFGYWRTNPWSRNRACCDVFFRFWMINAASANPRPTGRIWPFKLFSAALLLPIKIANLKDNQQIQWNYPKIWPLMSLFLKNAALVLIWVGRRWIKDFKKIQIDANILFKLIEPD
jgi:hypothetical protein